jgi:AsmA family/AsmA-like C-terminal region
MIENLNGRRAGRLRVWLAFSALAVILALVFVPPFISVRRYQNRITEVIAASVGRPVRLSSVELRIIPQPSFVITDLTVDEDPAYGAEPVLHANTVTASIRLRPLWWRARLEVSRISVDEASLNLVRTGAGKWNIDAFFRSAAARAQSVPGRPAMPFPYLEATDSRVNIKNGVEKLPFSLLNADLSFWQESPGDWRVRLKGQPARTDVSLDLADTGIVRLEGRLRREPGLPHMPIRLDVDWRNAQLGQLSRLVLGDDQGWRGDLAGEIHVDGTADAAQVTTRLRASGVHRAEFAPASPIDFDAACSLVYHYIDRGLEKLLCDSPVGNGRARLTGELPGRSSDPRLTLELDRVPAQLALDTLRTVRRGIDPSLQAEGAISGRISYSPPNPPDATLPARPAAKPAKYHAPPHAPPPGPLSGIMTGAAIRISGDSLSRAIFVQKVTVEPAPGQPSALVATLPIAAGAPAPLNITARLMLNGYEVSIRGGAAIARLRELAHVAGFGDASALQRLDGPPAVVDLTASGPWLRSSASPLLDATANLTSPSVLLDHLTGSITLHGASWKPDFLANPVELSNAVLHFDESAGHWDPVSFSYGPVRGAATLYLPAGCVAGDACGPQFTLDFGSLEAAALQAAILGARKPGTLLSNLLAKLRPGSTPEWPQLEGIVRASALLLGPVTLSNAEASLRVSADGTEIRSVDAALLGGRIHAEGSVLPGDKPKYQLKGQFDGLKAADLGRVLGMNWSGNSIGGTGAVELAGFTDHDLAASAKGELHFDWRHGSVADKGEGETPPMLAKFDRWMADAEIADGAITLKQNQVQRGARKAAVEGAATFGDPPRVTFGQPQDARAANGLQRP